jgi:hypothetical protein
MLLCKTLPGITHYYYAISGIAMQLVVSWPGQATQTPGSFQNSTSAAMQKINTSTSLLKHRDSSSSSETVFN